MNEQHRVLCASDMWATVVKEQMLPWVLDRIGSAEVVTNQFAFRFRGTA